MSYRAPGVTVTQEFLNALPALAAFSLPNVVVGPIFQVVKKASAGTYSGLLATVDWASQRDGTIVDLRAADPEDQTSFPVQIDLKNTVVRLQTGTAGEILVGSLNELTDATSAVFANVSVGDVIVIASGTNAGSYTVREVIDQNTLKTNETFVAAGSSISYSIRRNIGADGSLINIPISTTGVVLDEEAGVTLPAALTATVGTLGALPIINATILLTYRALRLENSAEVKEYASIASLQADFGLDQIVPENPAVFGAYVALNNSVTATNILGLARSYLEDEVIAYATAFDILELVDTYAISVMTQSTAVHTALKAHVEGMSVASKKLERVGLINRKLVTKADITDQVTDAATDGTGLIVSSASSAFITDGVVPGHFANIDGERVKIASVNSQTQITLASAVGTSLSGQDLIVDKDLSKNDQATTMAAYARSLGSRRLIMTYPSTIKMPVGNVIRELPGYFLNCAIGALTTGLPTQQGFTNTSISLFSGVKYSTKYFTNDQLNLIADGGVMIFIQEVLDQTALVVRHQLTTDRSAIKFQEFSVTKNVDFIAKFIRTYHQDFIGKYNIVDNTFEDLKTMAKGICTFLAESTKLPKIGGVIRNGRLETVQQDPVNIDTILERYVFDIPIPLNNLDITIVV